MIFWICFSILFLPLVLLFPIKRVGKKNLKALKKQNYIISCNHMSNMDAVMMDISMKKKYVYLAKKELFKNKFVGFFMRKFGGVPINREKVDPSSIKTVFKKLENGKNVAIFPQGTRKPTPNIDTDSAKEGVAMFAIRTGTPVVPMMYDKKIKIFRCTKLLIGEPIFPDETRKKDKDYTEEFANLIIQKMNDLLKEHTNNENERL